MATHGTASVFINDDESGLHRDYDVWLEKLAPHAPTSQYEHNRTGEDNADAHMKRQIMGREVVVAITKVKDSNYRILPLEGGSIVIDAKGHSVKISLTFKEDSGAKAFVGNGDYKIRTSAD